jgi:hypothetical protein
MTKYLLEQQIIGTAMDKKLYIPNAVKNLLQTRYNILDHISFLGFDSDFDSLKSRLLSLKKEKYHIDDKILVEHTDTDFYFEHCTVGLNLLNFFTVVNQIDIPKHVFLFYTNHFGLKKEIERICKDPNDQPSLIESFVDNLHYNPGSYNNVDLTTNKITHQALCMMHIQRSHRNAMYHAVKDISDLNLIKAFTVK